MQATSRVTFHLDLSHDRDTGAREYWVKGYRSKHPVRAHTAQTLAEARLHNSALAAMPAGQLARFTHFAEDVVVSQESPHHVRVHYQDAGSPLPALVAMTIHVPQHARVAARTTTPALGKVAEGVAVPNATLAAYGVPSATLAMTLDADQLMTPLETAKSILFHHPELASLDSYTATIVMDTIANTGDIDGFALNISSQGAATTTGGFATITACTDEHDQPAIYDPNGPWAKAGQTVYHYKLSEETTGAIGQGPLCEAIRKTKDDLRLHNRRWSVNPGRPATTQPPGVVPPQQAAIGEAGTAGYTFTLNNKTPGHGLDVPSDLLYYDGDTFTIAARNDYLRTLSAYVRFRDDAGAVLTNIDGFQGSWDGVLDHPDAGKYFCGTVSAVNTILGVPMPTDPTKLSFTWPEQASQADLLWGGIGLSDWDSDTDIVGAVATGIFQYAVPVLFLAAGAAIKSSGWYKALVADKEMMLALIELGAFVFAGYETYQWIEDGWKKALFTLADKVSGFLVDSAVEKLATWVFTQIVVAEVEDAIPFVGWVARAVNMAITGAQIAETTVEVCKSPATYTVEVKRELQLQLTVHPDPTHGRTQRDAIWPTEADHWVAIVQYKDGTNYRQTAALPVGGHAADPVVTTFTDLPAGSKLQVVFGVYSSSDWLAGRWQSAWTDAIVPQQETPLMIEGAIQESLVPLTARTQYHYTQKIAWDPQSSSHVWHEGDQPTATVEDLNTSNTGDNLGGLAGITLNDKAYMLGYCWTASGQNYPGAGCQESGQSWSFANINTLADPSVGYKFSECGFSDQPFIVYDQFGPAPLFTLPAAAEPDLDAATVSATIQNAFAAANYPITNSQGQSVATITVITPSAEWSIAVGGTTLYDIRRITDQIQVHPWPQPAFSPNNFYAEPKLVDNEINFFLRQVVLDDTTTFGVGQPNRKTFGYFTIPHMDAFAVHPNGYVIAASWANSTIQVLKLSPSAVDDSQAMPALTLGGQGTRQGLMSGPCGLAVTEDGRILVLESINQRIQALDINGNPVHCFDGGVVPNLSPAAADSAATLDTKLAPLPLRQAFSDAGVKLSSGYRIDAGDTFYILSHNNGSFDVMLGSGQDLSTQWTVADTTNGAVYQVSLLAGGAPQVSQDSKALFDLAAGDLGMLRMSAVSTDILNEFKQHGYYLPEAADVKVIGNGYHIDGGVETSLAQGTIPDSLRAAFQNDRGIALPASCTLTPTVTVQVLQAGATWLLTDTVTDTSYRITVDEHDQSLLSVHYWNAAMALHDPGSTVTYLDIATEMKGYIYVLSHTGGQTPQQSDYYLDIYAPTGAWLSRTPDGTDPQATHPNAAKMRVDQWRTMFTLNYEHYQSDHGTEPSVSQWVPNTPH
ncbi:hypothetical protein [Mycobacterium simiae]|uniref:NHL repeat containing protein n=1 Tax=Mycobacterium simiae TaxID=1784 RepID=A0A1X0XRM0_MYCSI|nr:hypothetical protein [Mycobacterium simiae]ORJ55516.1 hypothetical protein B5M45_24415 [Mycobacterium simiae]